MTLAERPGEASELREHLRRTLVALEELLGKLPIPGDLKERIAELRRLIVDQRPPRLAVVGRRGSGKSSLINALFGELVAEVGHEKAQTGKASWYHYQGSGGRIEILDTRGFQEGSTPTAADVAVSPLESIRAALRATSADALLFLVRASDVDSAVDEDIKLLVQISSAVDARHGSRTPIIGVITHADQVEPKNAKLHDAGASPEDIAEKLARIARMKDHLESKLVATPELRDRLATVLGVSSYQSWRKDGSRRDDERWQIETLVRYLFDELPREARVELARFAKVRKIQHEVADVLTQATAGICAGIAAVPIPLGDIVPITSAQLTLVVAIGHLAGRELTMNAAGEFLGAFGVNVGAAYAFREAARAVIKFVFPGAGSVVSAAVAYGGTMGIGKAASAYFIDGLSAADAKAIFEKERKEASKPPHS